MKYTFFGCVSLRPCYTRQYSLQPTTQHHCAASCRRNKACNTPSSATCNATKNCEASCRKNWRNFLLFATLRKPVTACNVSTSNLQCFDVVSITLQVAEEIAWCNKALITCTHSYLSPIRPWEGGGGGGGKCLLSITFLNIQVVPTKCSDVY